MKGGRRKERGCDQGRNGNLLWNRTGNRDCQTDTISWTLQEVTHAGCLDLFHFDSQTEPIHISLPYSDPGT